MLDEVEGNEIDDEREYMKEEEKRRTEGRWRRFENEEDQGLVG